MDNLAEFMQLCRLCLVKDQVNVPIFEEQGDIRQIFLKITACLPVKVSKDDSLPKKICDGCLYKLELLYQFWNTTANAEKQLLSWLSQAGMEADSKTTQEAVAIALQTQVATHSVKEEEIDPPESTPESTDDLTTEAESFIMQPPQLPFEPAGAQFEEPSEFNESQEQSHASDDNGAQNDDSQDADDVEPPPPKRSRRQAAIKAAQLVARKDEDDDEDDEEEEDEDDVDDPSVEATVPKTEEESEDEMDESGTNPEPTDFVSLGTADEEQPGPSGVGKVDSEAPGREEVKQEFEEDRMNLLERLVRLKKRKSSKTKLGKNWHCRTCSREFDSLKKVLHHRRDVHREEEAPDDNYTNLDEVYRCKLCSTTTMSKSEIEKHLVSHVEEFNCGICQRSFSSTYRYAYHMKAHTTDEEFCCPLCDMKTLNSQALFRHINTKHLKNFPYYCKHCDKGFSDKNRFFEHENFHKLGKVFTCIVCDAKFSYSGYLMAHQVRAHTVWIEGDVVNQCTICKKKFAKDEYLETHMRKSHGDMRIYLCENCGKKFSTTTKLKQHYRIHTGIKPFACGYCEKSFSKKEYLVLHVRTHTGEKPYSCEYCAKSFSQPSTLKIHVRSHTGEKPFVCQMCSAAFPVKASLTAHYRACKGQ